MIESLCFYSSAICRKIRVQRRRKEAREVPLTQNAALRDQNRSGNSNRKKITSCRSKAGSRIVVPPVEENYDGGGEGAIDSSPQVTIQKLTLWRGAKRGGGHSYEIGSYVTEYYTRQRGNPPRQTFHLNICL